MNPTSPSGPLNPLFLQLVQVIFQSISALAIFGGLIYTAIQFRKSRRATHVANFTKLVELQMHLREMRVKDPKLAYVYRHDMLGLHTDEEIREYFFNLMQLSVFEIVWFSHREGQLPDDYYLSWVRRMMDIAREQSFQQMIGSQSMKILHDDFQRFVLRLVEEAKRGEPIRPAPAP